MLLKMLEKEIPKEEIENNDDLYGE